ncbi:MAG: NUDIX domain-containing protein [Oscillospiraceae bacterium]|nr:NUDIX domain-containing protein [Oscillospiraceae bacterium]
MNYERSCGGVLFTVKNDVPYFVLVEENYYGFPKGHMEPGETERKTAIREIREETGVNASIVGDFRKVDHYMLKHKPDTEKTVVYFLAYYEDQEIVYQEEELNGAVLVPFSEAMKLVTHVRLKKVLREANRAALRWIEKQKQQKLRASANNMKR